MTRPAPFWTLQPNNRFRAGLVTTGARALLPTDVPIATAKRGCAMARVPNATSVLGLFCVILALVVAFLWIPLDVETGLIEKVRRQTSIGDAAMPSLACVFIFVGGAMLFLPSRIPAVGLTRGNLGFLFGLLVILAVTFALMRWLGPVAANILGAEGGYRPLRDTVPWKYIGYLTGGTVMVAGLMALAEGRFTRRGLIVGFLASAALVVVYDLPFEDLLLPPNGDV